MLAINRYSLMKVHPKDMIIPQIRKLFPWKLNPNDMKSMSYQQFSLRIWIFSLHKQYHNRLNTISKLSAQDLSQPTIEWMYILASL